MHIFSFLCSMEKILYLVTIVTYMLQPLICLSIWRPSVLYPKCTRPASAFSFCFFVVFFCLFVCFFCKYREGLGLRLFNSQHDSIIVVE